MSAYAWRREGAAVVPYAIALFFFPIVYYVTHPEDYCRRPIDPFFLVLAVYAITVYIEQRRARKANVGTAGSSAERSSAVPQMTN